MLKHNKIHIFATIIPLVVALIITWFSGVGIAYAAEPVYSGALQDLQKDPAFDASAYPDNINAKREELIQVIQIAESADGELLIYTYQPATRAKQIKASSINIAHETDNSTGLGFVNYSLTYISSDGVFYKYKVNDFEIRPEALRYYNISQIMRPYDKGIDGTLGHGQTSSEMSVEVAQLWTAVTVNGQVSYTKKETDVVTITKKYVGFVTYQDGTDVKWDKWYNILTGYPNVSATLTSKHFVAFSFEYDLNGQKQYDVDKLIDVDIQYSLQKCNYELCCNVAHTIVDNSHTMGDTLNIKKGAVIQQEPIKVTGDQVGENVKHGLLGHHYKWDRIQRTSDFIKDESNDNYQMTTEGVTDVLGTDWVISFHDVVETREAFSSVFDGHAKCETEIVSDVMILRLKFEKDGTTYNLGVVDNKQTGDGKPDNVYTGAGDKKQAAKIGATVGIIGSIILVIVGIVLLCVFCPQAVLFVGGKVRDSATAFADARRKRRNEKKAEPAKSANSASVPRKSKANKTTSTKKTRKSTKNGKKTANKNAAGKRGKK